MKRERVEGKKGKRKSIKRRVEEAAREVLVGNISRPCHFSNSGSCIPDIRAKCPRFSRVHSSDREADSVSINYTRQIPPRLPIFIYSSRRWVVGPTPLWPTDERGKTVGWARMGELALWTERTWWCARVWREEKRKEKAEWRELRGEVNFSRVGSDKDEAASTLSPSKNTRSTALMVARTCASPLFQTRETFTISLNPFAISARRSLAVGFPRNSRDFSQIFCRVF